MHSYCDLDQCKCHQGFIHNGTHCTEDPNFAKVKEQPTIASGEIGKKNLR